MRTVILIPAYNPDKRLLSLIYKLKFLFAYVLIVDDGSEISSSSVFKKIDSLPFCEIIHHKENMGKGAAIKTGLKYIKEKKEQMTGIITADADGQHLAEDIQKVDEVFGKNSNSLVLGSRNFRSEIIPFKSKFGNLLTRVFFKLITGKTVFDTQTGLRAIPFNIIDDFLKIPGCRYEYEMNMLFHAAKRCVNIIEVPIETVYIEQNRSSHFHPIKDSLRIYKEVIKYSISSLLCSAVDIGLFAVLFHLMGVLGNSAVIFKASAAARLVSSVLNFFLNKLIVFKIKGNLFLQGVKYFLLCVVQIIISWLLVELFIIMNLGGIVIVKIIADILLFFISYYIQKLYVFYTVHNKIK